MGVAGTTSCRTRCAAAMDDPATMEHFNCITDGSRTRQLQPFWLVLVMGAFNSGEKKTKWRVNGILPRKYIHIYMYSIYINSVCI